MDKEYLFLPEVTSQYPKKSHQHRENSHQHRENSHDSINVYPCPCCQQLTFPVPKEEAIAYICPLCQWENDVFLLQDDEPSDENHGLSLAEARRNYKLFGTSSPKQSQS